MGIARWQLGPMLTLFLGGSELGAVVKPDLARLARMTVRINDHELDILAGQKLELIRGDQVVLLYATLEQSTQSPESVNFVGFRGDGPRRYLEDDRYVVIDTVKLKRGWSIDKQGRLYRIEAKTGKTIHGEVEVVITKPELEQLDLEVDGQHQALGPGSVLELKSTDRIQVKNIRTNHPRLDREVRVQFVDQGIQDGVKVVKLDLLHRQFSFASIWLHMKP